MATPDNAVAGPQQETQPGIHILYPPKDKPVETTLECSIVAVHGLMGRSFSTWTDPKTGHLWLRDFLPKDIPAARISSFGYDAEVFGRSVLKLGDVANNLLAAIRSIRDEKVFSLHDEW
ncbi:uncharacterized protein A1O9_11077 [Exophiala aquamarina CBS 119918]|uniref:DUF676 domain-containing protein n=1 Tax=Exophiala aquamarina CBS 119918 TaxID=1182545 RepID=A0A072PAQ0_9EURO|nr:uncharacterized protein A1O9_11077 [Exophiala aquamarina CBS 119918]KEF52660.1 hypothetical protein A1O9_11077 [Exophiala aquamarina CBS 119918]